MDGSCFKDRAYHKDGLPILAIIVGRWHDLARSTDQKAGHMTASDKRTNLVKNVLLYRSHPPNLRGALCLTHGLNFYF